MLTRDGHEVQTAADGLQALDLYRRSPFDLICLDLDMPRLSGIEVTRSVRAHAPDGVPILMITASATSSDVHEAHAAGITALLTKPFQTSQL